MNNHPNQNYDYRKNTKSAPVGHCQCMATPQQVELRTKPISGGGVQYVYQCTVCGIVRSTPLKRDEAFRLSGGKEPNPWDVELREFTLAVMEQQRQQRATVREEFLSKQNTEWWSGYNDYLKSPAWAERRRRVLARCGDICEGCRNRPVEHVHHLTYEHVGNELLFELVGLCERCHVIAHNGKDFHK